MCCVSKTAIKSILKSKRIGDDNLDLLPTLVASIQNNPSNAELIFSIFGLFLNVASDVKGLSALESLDDINTVAVGAIRDHPNSPELHEVTFALLQNTVNADCESEDSANLILLSMKNYPEEEMLQINGCKLLALLCSQSQAAQTLARNDLNILSLASENYSSCQRFVDGILGN